MLIEFSVSNFKSIRETQTLTMAASKYFKEMENENCIDTGITGLPKLLRSAVIYGSNASGKSNLLSAIDFMNFMVRSSVKDIEEGEVLSVVPFRLDRDSKSKDSEFEIIFVEEKTRYQYGFAVNKTRVTREWLIAYPERRPQRWFDREYNQRKELDDYTFGPRFQGGRLRQEWKNATRSNALFLSVAVQFNSEQLKPVFNWFQKRLRVLNPPVPFFPGITSSVCETKEDKEKVINFLKVADLSINDISITKEKISSAGLIAADSKLPENFKKIMKVMDGVEIDRILFLHKNNETGELIPFDISNESNGTKNLFGFAGYWVKMMSNNQVLFVDEIDTSLHPLIVQSLVNLFHRSGSNAQLIFTTHDTSLLSQNIMRRDQIWFIEKGESGVSRLYSLVDFKVREREALERGYLRGRYGAIPFIKEPV